MKYVNEKRILNEVAATALGEVAGYVVFRRMDVKYGPKVGVLPVEQWSKLETFASREAARTKCRTQEKHLLAKGWQKVKGVFVGYSWTLPNDSMWPDAAFEDAVKEQCRREGHGKLMKYPKDPALLQCQECEGLVMRSIRQDERRQLTKHCTS